MRILTVPNDTKILRSKSQGINKIDDELVKFMADLGKTLKRQSNPQGIGLSAVQVGRPVRVFATLLEAGRKKEEGKGKKDGPELIYYINPEIVNHPKEMTLGEDLVESNAQRSTGNAHPFLEGCLSIPKIYGTVLRWPWIKTKTMILTEQSLSSNSVFSIQYSVFTLDALAARVFQHELDHLNGILFTDHTMAQNGIMYREKKERLEEISL
ncbi:peptide deformylase [Candidatus Collierbacteria bacterium]|nr:peptide deformylase [Candidatus Collierbacteria bacterium]